MHASPQGTTSPNPSPDDTTANDMTLAGARSAVGKSRREFLDLFKYFGFPETTLRLVLFDELHRSHRPASEARRPEKLAPLQQTEAEMVSQVSVLQDLVARLVRARHSSVRTLGQRVVARLPIRAPSKTTPRVVRTRSFHRVQSLRPLSRSAMHFGVFGNARVTERARLLTRPPRLETFETETPSTSTLHGGRIVHDLGAYRARRRGLGYGHVRLRVFRGVRSRPLVRTFANIAHRRKGRERHIFKCVQRREKGTLFT